MGLEELDECIDPLYQRNKGVDTYYPKGTICFKDPSSGIALFYKDRRSTIFAYLHSFKNRIIFESIIFQNLVLSLDLLDRALCGHGHKETIKRLSQSMIVGPSV